MRITEESMKLENPELNGPGQLAGSEETAPQQPKLTEREKLNHMSNKDKAWYIWNYYRWHFAAVVAAIALVVVIGQCIYRSTFDTAIHLLAINTQIGEEDLLTPTMEEFHTWAELGDKELISAETFLIDYNEHSEYSMANLTKVATLAAACDLDVIIGDTATIDYYAPSGAFLDLTDALSPELLELLKDRLYYASDDSGNTIACAVDISETAFAEKSNLTRRTALLGIVQSSTRQEISLEFLEYAVRD